MRLSINPGNSFGFFVDLTHIFFVMTQFDLTENISGALLDSVRCCARLRINQCVRIRIHFSYVLQMLFF